MTFARAVRLASAALLAAACAAALPVRAETQIVGGRVWECRDGMCVPAGTADGADGAFEAPPVSAASAVSAADAEDVAEASAPRIAHGWMGRDEFIAFLRGEDAPSPYSGAARWAMLLLAAFAGLCMNLTPCVLPMVPVNLMIVGRSASRGLLYAAGMASAYGVLGVLAASGGMAFGELQGDPRFNLAVCVLFAALSLSFFGVFRIDFSAGRNSLSGAKSRLWPWAFAFFMGAVAAVLAGACVAPALVSTLVLAASLGAKGDWMAFALPFALGIGMAAPWPFAAAGMKAFPKPGAWTAHVQKVFGVVAVVFAAWFGRLAWTGFAADGGADAQPGGDAVEVASPEEFDPGAYPRPLLVDCWAPWCKNCAAMERTTLSDPEVAAEMGRFTTVRIRADDVSALRRLPGFSAVAGLPAFLVFE